MISVWAQAIDVPTRVCFEARRSENAAEHEGQTGWDIGLQFRSLDDLLRQLRETQLPEYVVGEPAVVRNPLAVGPPFVRQYRRIPYEERRDREPGN